MGDTGSTHSPADFTTDVLIIGAGPAGASLACFLARHQISATVISMDPSTTVEPRAHLINAATVECLRDIGLEEECRQSAIPYTEMPYIRFSKSLTGEEFWRLPGHWSVKPAENKSQSPCDAFDLPQNLLEPILMKRVSEGETKVKWNTEFISCVDLGDSVVSTCIDNTNGKTFTISSRFLCGADGGRSKVVDQIELPFSMPNKNLATCYSILFEADLSDVVRGFPSLLQLWSDPMKEPKPYCVAVICRTVKPFHQFQFISLPAPDFPGLHDLDEIDWAAVILEHLDDQVKEVKVLQKTKYHVNEAVAEFYSKGNIFCLGDAVHRHPPASGLGANTCIQDAYNLAWKLAYVLQGKADPALLSTYSLERQPVGQQVVKRANDSFLGEMALVGCVGLLDPDVNKRRSHMHLLEQPGPEGQSARARLRQTHEAQKWEFFALGAEMNHFYQSGAVYTEDEPEGQKSFPKYHQDKDLHYAEGTLPGMRLPHAWLCPNPPGQFISTHDLAGQGRFTLVTGVGGKDIWSSAVAEALKYLKGIAVEVFSIGFHQDYEDRYYQWEDKRGVQESGAVLVRPDRFVCWRSSHELDVEEAAAKIERVLRKILAMN